MNVIAGQQRLAAVIAAAWGAQVTPPPLPDGVRAQLDAVLNAPLQPAAPASKSDRQQLELKAALGIEG